MNGLRIMLAATIFLLAAHGHGMYREQLAPENDRVRQSMSYSGDLSLEPGLGTLTAQLMIRVPVEAQKRSLEFFLNSGFEIKRVHGGTVTDYSLTPIEDNPAWSRLEIEFDPDPADEELAFEIAYAGMPEMPENGINRIKEDWVELSVDSAWHPILSTLTQPIFVELDLAIPADWTVVTSGTVTDSPTGRRIVSRFPQIDISFIAAPGLNRAGTEAIEVFHRGVEQAALDLLIDRAAACRDWLDRRFGASNRLPPLRFVVTGRAESGYARQNYIVLTRVEGRNPIDLTEFLCHELSHYWSRGAPPGTVENWLNEGFAVFIAAEAIRDFYGTKAHRRLVEDWTHRAAGAASIWTSDDRRRRGYAVNYKKAPLFLHHLKAEIGKQAFAELLKRYALQPINSTAALLDAIEDIAGRDARHWALARLAATGDPALGER